MVSVSQSGAGRQRSDTLIAMRIRPEEFQALDLEVHSFLRDVSLHDVSSIDLPGGGPARTISDIRSLLSAENMATAGGSVRALFAFRRLLGRALGWDRDTHAHPDESYLHRLTDDHIARSLLPPGTPDGPFQLLYVFPRELVGEIRNATVHGFSCMSLQPLPSGYRFYWAVYVKPVSRLTPCYMALIEPFRRFVVYPTILRRLRASWAAAFARDSE